MAENYQAADKESAQLITFTYNPTDSNLRIKEIDGSLWFVAKDVCKILNITWSGHTLDQIPKEWKGMVKLTTPGGMQELTSISEAGMYKLAFRCQSSDAADKFTNWVAGEILPSIRKTGRYEMPSPAPKALRSPRVKPRDRSAEMGEFFLELRRWVRRSDVDETAELCGVRRKSVMDVLGGLKPGADVLELLVAYAKDNRSRGRMTDIQRSRREDYARRAEQLRLEFMEEGGAR